MLRKAGIISTLTCFLVGGTIVLYYFFYMTQHARIDSEGGTFVYGMIMLVCLTATMLGIFIGSIMWGIGIRATRGSIIIKRTEIIFQRLFAIVSGLWGWFCGEKRITSGTINLTASRSY